MKKIKKNLKRVLLAFGITVALLLAVIAIAINFVFTPERITPVITELLNDHLDAKVSCQSMELTFFSTFPYFGVKLENGNVAAMAAKGIKQDTLAQFETCQISFNLQKLLRTHDLVVNNISLVNAKIKAVRLEDGKSNWDIVKNPSNDTVANSDETSFKINSLLIKKLNIKNASIGYHDFSTKTHAKADSINVELKVSNTDQKLILSTQADSRKVGFSKDGYWFANDLKIEFAADISYDKKKHSVVFEKSGIKINNIDFITEGRLERDTLTNEVKTDIAMEMKIPSLEILWEAVPKRILKKEDIDVRGNAMLKFSAKGVYSKKNLPVIAITFKIKDGLLKYRKFPGEIKHLEADVHALLDYNKPENSLLTVNKILLQGTGVDLEGSAKITSLLKSPDVDCNIKGNLNLTTIKNKFPIAKEIEAGGLANLDINAIFNSGEIMNNNFSNVIADGTSSLQDFVFSAPKDTVYFRTKSTIIEFERSKGGMSNRKFLGKIVASDLKLNYKKQHEMNLSGLDIRFSTKNKTDSLPTIKAEIRLSDLHYSNAHNTNAAVRNANMTTELKAGNRKDRPTIVTAFTVDSAGVWQDKKFIGIKNGNYKLSVRKNREEIWMPRGDIEFNNLYAYMPEFAPPLRMEHSKISISNRSITLKNARVLFGNSDVILTGQINNMLAKKASGLKISASLALSSNFIDANEIMKVMAEGTDKMITDLNPTLAVNKPLKSSADYKKTAFKVPENISLVFESNIKQLHYGTLDLKNLKGLLQIEDGHLKLHQFELTTLAAKLVASINYSATKDDKAKIDFDFSLEDVEMANISKLMPAMDSLFPMAKSLEGQAKLKMQGTGMLDRNMEVIIPSVKSIAALQASGLKILDGETFRDLAKTLMFKDRSVNTIQTLNMEMLLQDSHMEILPALVEIDRYQLAVGGIQNLDMTYDYHISILKSPIPFKTGVDIKGNMEDYKIRLVKAKYKYYFTDKQRLKDKADESVIAKKKLILSKLDLE